VRRAGGVTAEAHVRFECASMCTRCVMEVKAAPRQHLLEQVLVHRQANSSIDKLELALLAG